MSQPFVPYRPGQNASSASSVGDAKNSAADAQPPPTQHEHLLAEIESSEGNLAGVLRLGPQRTLAYPTRERARRDVPLYFT